MGPHRICSLALTTMLAVASVTVAQEPKAPAKPPTRATPLAKRTAKPGPLPVAAPTPEPTPDPKPADPRPQVAVMAFDYGTIQAQWWGNYDIGTGVADQIVDSLVNDGNQRAV